MIGALKGIPVKTDTNTLLVMVSGVGYTVVVTPSFYGKVHEKEILVYIYTHVKEDMLDLYGFEHRQELSLFKLLIGVSGVGPKIGITIVDYGIDNIHRAVAEADVAFFTQIPKVGKKMAQKIIIDLKSKLGSIAELELSDDTSGQTSELIETLTSMGFAKDQAIGVIKTLPDNADTMEKKLRYALKTLGK